MLLRLRIFIQKLPYWPQWLVGLIVSLAVLVTGLGNGWTSPYLAQLTSPEAKLMINLTAEEASWVASFLNLGRFIGSICGAMIQGFIGRKKSILVGAVPMVVGWICIMVATSVTYLYAARLFLGTASGVIWSGISLFIGEIADPKIRGSLIFWILNVTTIGGFLGTVIGPYLPMEQFSCVTLALTGVFIITFSLVPDTPHHYIINGDLAKAEESLRWYKCQNDVTGELKELQEFVGLTKISLARRLREFGKSVHRKNFGAMLVLSILLYCAGHNTMSYYAEIIVTRSKVDLDASTVVMGLGFCSIIASASGTCIVDRMERKTLLVASSVMATIAMAALGYHFHLIARGTEEFESAAYKWLPVVSLTVYNFSLAWGLVPVPCALVSEIFPPIVKTMASMSLSTASSLLSFAAAKSFQPFVDLVGEDYVFWAFSVSAFSSAVFAWFFVPETRGKSLVQIQKDLTEKKIHRNEKVHQASKIEEIS